MLPHSDLIGVTNKVEIFAGELKFHTFREVKPNKQAYIAWKEHNVNI